MGKSSDELDSDVSEGEKNGRPFIPLNTTTQKRLKRTKLNFKRKGVNKTKPNGPHFKERKPPCEEFKSNLGPWRRRCWFCPSAYLRNPRKLPTGEVGEPQVMEASRNGRVVLDERPSRCVSGKLLVDKRVVA